MRYTKEDIIRSLADPRLQNLKLDERYCYCGTTRTVVKKANDPNEAPIQFDYNFNLEIDDYYERDKITTIPVFCDAIILFDKNKEDNIYDHDDVIVNDYDLSFCRFNDESLFFYGDSCDDVLYNARACDVDFVAKCIDPVVTSERARFPGESFLYFKGKNIETYERIRAKYLIKVNKKHLAKIRKIIEGKEN